MAGAQRRKCTLLARQQRQLLAETGTMRDDLAVMTAILQKLDRTVSDLVNEVRAMHAPLSNRVRDLGAQP